MIAFRKKWSILLDVDTLRGHSESDEINLWLLTKKHLQEFAPNLTPSFVANYPRKNKTIYLSGGQQFAVDGGANWRSMVSPILYRAGYDVFNPVFEGQAVLDTYGVNFDQLTLEEYIGAGGMFIEKDLEAIKSSDAVLTLIDQSAMRGAGTKSEATIAVDYNIPNFFVLADDFEARKLPIWLAGCIRNKKFLFEHNDFVGAVKAIKRSV
jgi:nucleoside 2-deoxyribosyltransferase